MAAASGWQEGPEVTIAEGHFHPNQVEFRTQKYIWISDRPKNRKKYKSIATRDRFLKILTRDLSPGSHERIKYICRCGGSTDRIVKTIKSAICSKCGNKKVKGQLGRIIFIPAGHFSAEQGGFRTKMFTLVNFLTAVNSRLNFVIEGSAAKVLTKDLAPFSHVKILRVCDCFDGKGRIVSLSDISAGKECMDCRGISKRSVSRTLKKSKIEEKYGIKILGDYQNTLQPVRYAKPCGHEVFGPVSHYRDGNHPRCECDEIETWRYFEQLIRAELGGGKGRERRFRVDCLNSNFAAEVKLNYAAIFSNHSKRDVQVITRKYRKEALKRGLDFYVIVNEPQASLTRLPKYYLGWESWPKVGIGDEVVKIGKQISGKPWLFRRLVLSSTQVKIKNKFIAKCQQIGGRLVDIKLFAKDVGIPSSELKVILTGNSHATVADIADALFLRDGLKFQTATVGRKRAREELLNMHSSFENIKNLKSRPREPFEAYKFESWKSGHLLSDPETKDLLNLSLIALASKATGRKRPNMREFENIFQGELKFIGGYKNAFNFHKSFLIKKLREFWRVHGKVPVSAEMGGESGLPHYDTYRKTFGSLESAIIEADIGTEADTLLLKVNNEKFLKKASLMLMEFFEASGSFPDAKEFDRFFRSKPFCAAAIKGRVKGDWYEVVCALAKDVEQISIEAKQLCDKMLEKKRMLRRVRCSSCNTWVITKRRNFKSCKNCTDRKICPSCNSGFKLNILKMAERPSRTVRFLPGAEQLVCNSCYQRLLTMDKVIGQIEKKGGNFSFATLPKSDQLIKVTCKKGHEFERTLKDLSVHKWCSVCSPWRIPFQKMADEFKAEYGLKCISDSQNYKNAFSSLEWQCSHCNAVFKSSRDNLNTRIRRHGFGCLKCQTTSRSIANS
jgi:hypothetical protein